MKNRLFYLIAAVIILVAMLFSAAALLRGCAERPVTPSQPVDPTGHDVALSETLCLDLLASELTGRIYMQAGREFSSGSQSS